MPCVIHSLLPSALRLLAALALLINVVASPQSTARKEASMTHATGTFEVKTAPQDAKPDSALGRFSLDKEFHGDLEAASQGEMLTATTSVKGSAAYVALEQVHGSLPGRTGAFILQHTGVMDRGTPRMVITVVPDSGTGQLEGLAGTMTITITEGKHFYDFEYSLPGSN
jgi:hypothetical protein